MIERVVKGGPIDNALSLVKKFAVRGPGSFAITEAGGHLAGVSPLAFMAVGEGARAGAEYLTTSRAQDAIDLALGGKEAAARNAAGRRLGPTGSRRWRTTPAVGANLAAQNPIDPSQ